MAKKKTDYDIAAAFARIEDEIIASMMRNLSNHRAEETVEGYNWSQWQVEQLAALDAFKKRNAKKYGKQFRDINNKIKEIISVQRAEGNANQEIRILEAIRKGFKPVRASNALAIDGEFFKINDRKMDALIQATQNDLQKGEQAILRRANDQYRKIIFDAQVYANSGAGTYEKAVDMAVKDFLMAGINCIQYSNGARHTMSDYADMAIKTAGKRAYLTGEGEKRKEYGITTVRVNKRGKPCPLCLPFVGRVLIDDVWSGGKPSDGPYPLMSQAMTAGLYHPRCKDIHSTYIEGISSPAKPWTDKEIADIEKGVKRESKKKHASKQAEKYGRLARYSLDPDNKRKYKAREEEWKEQEKKYTDEEMTMISSYDIEESQGYRPIDRSKTTTKNMRGNMEILMRKIQNSTYRGDFFISDSVVLKPKQMHNIEMSVNEALKIVGESDNLPACMIISPDEMQTHSICSYNAEKNILYISSVISDSEKLLELQKDMACSDNPLSTYVHEFIHWKDAEEYRKTVEITDQRKYLEYLRIKCKKKLDKLEKQGYNIFDISEYAKEKYLHGLYDETWTEYRVSKLLKKG